MKFCPTCKSTYPQDFAVCPRDGKPLEEAGVWSEGTTVRGKYRILAKIGEGGMGAVYKALHLRFNEVRALKVMSVALTSDPNFVKRFEKEAVLTRKLQHPNAVRVDDIDEAEDGRPFIVMEYIEGRSLKQVIQAEGTLPVARVLTIIKQVSSALDAAHQLSVVHRDIKPENIVLVETPGGEEAKVLDFGIARIREAEAGRVPGLTLTETGVIIGSPPYMSPEQAMGLKGDQLDGRSDLYSLGVVMYQMLTGTLPLKADTTMSILMAHIQTPPTPIFEARPDLHLPESIAGLVMRMLEKKPEARPASGKAVIEIIESAEKDPALLRAGTIVAVPAATVISRVPQTAGSSKTGPAPLVLQGSPSFAPSAATPAAGSSVIPVTGATPGSNKSFWHLTWPKAAILVIALAAISWGAFQYGKKRAFDDSHELGHELMQKGDLEGAIVEFRKALKFRPDLDHVRLDLAVALQSKGEKRAALEEFEVVCTRSPDLPECRENYRNLLKQLKLPTPQP